MFFALVFSVKTYTVCFISRNSSLNEDRPTPSEELFLNLNDRNSLESVIDQNGNNYSAPLTHKKDKLLQMISKYTITPNDTMEMVLFFVFFISKYNKSLLPLEKPET